MLRFLGKLTDDTRGATAVEYGLILAFMVLTMLGALRGFTGEAIDMWEEITSKSAEVQGG